MKKKANELEKEALASKIALYEQAKNFLEERNCILPIKTTYNPKTLLVFINEQLNEMRGNTLTLNI